jgi:hypothetical protein
MTYEEFEWHILRMVYEHGLQRIQPAYIAYALGLPHDKTTDYLERAAQSGVLEMEVTDDGHLEYFVPGVDPDSPMPQPAWRDDQPSQSGPAAQLNDPPSDAQVKQVDERFAEARDNPEVAQDNAADGSSTARAGRAAPAEQTAPEADGALMRRDQESTDGPSDASPPDGQMLDRIARSSVQSRTDGQSGSSADSRSTALAPRDDERGGEMKRTERTSNVPQRERETSSPGGADGSVKTADHSDIPTELRDHILDRKSAADGTVDETTDMTVIDREASVDSNDMPPVVAALENSDRDLPIKIESTEETFSDPSQTIFMRRLRVEGVESEAALREHVHRLFDSLGYQMVDDESRSGRMRFERGSVTFILALVPLFVLVLPLFVYLFLYCMGRSTIHQEPLELDVQMRPIEGRTDAYEIDLTFIGLHGVVLGSADQRVLNKEVDTLRDELQWALGS